MSDEEDKGGVSIRLTSAKFVDAVTALPEGEREAMTTALAMAVGSLCIFLGLSQDQMGEAAAAGAEQAYAFLHPETVVTGAGKKTLN